MNTAQKNNPERYYEYLKKELETPDINLYTAWNKVLAETPINVGHFLYGIDVPDHFPLEQRGGKWYPSKSKDTGPRARLGDRVPLAR